MPLPAREDVFRVADEMRAEAIRISIRTVRKRLPNGGFYRSIGEHLADWKVDRCYQTVLEASQIPEALQRQLAALGNPGRIAIPCSIRNARIWLIDIR